MTPKKRTVRTRIEPGRELEVDQAEHTRLKQLGVLISDGDVPVRVASERVDGGPGTGLAVRAEASAPRGAALPTHNIQTVFRPDLTITVSDDEYQQLLAEGLVYSGNPQAPAADAYDLLFASKVSGGTATPAALRTAFVPKWKANTAYVAGEFVLNPSGQIVSANTAFTSGATYSSSNWTVVSGGGGGAGALLSVNNLSDVASAATARTNLGLGSAATQPTTAFDAAGAAAAAQTAAQSYAAGVAAGLALVFGA